MALKKRSRVTPDFNMASMIDIVFLLLMFFMLTSKFVTPNALNLSLPSSSSTSMASPSLAVSVDKSGNFFLDGKPIAKDRVLSGVELRIKALGKPINETTLTVVADKNSSVENVVYILDIANKLKIKTILATDPEQ